MNFGKFIINLGTANPAKVGAVEKVFRNYYKKFQINPFNVNTGVPDQPITLEQTLTGAKNRAINSYNLTKCDIGVGIESGCIDLSNIKFGTTAIVIYDGQKDYIGFSSCWQVPDSFIKMLNNGYNFTQIAIEHNLTTNKSIGSDIGMEGLLSKSKINDYHSSRGEFIEQGLISALIYYRNNKSFRINSSL